MSGQHKLSHIESGNVSDDLILTDLFKPVDLCLTKVYGLILSRNLFHGLCVDQGSGKKQTVSREWGCTERAMDFEITISNLYLYQTRKGNPRAKAIDKRENCLV